MKFVALIIIPALKFTIVAIVVKMNADANANTAFVAMHAPIAKINKNKMNKDLLCQHM